MQDTDQTFEDCVLCSSCSLLAQLFCTIFHIFSRCAAVCFPLARSDSFERHYETRRGCCNCVCCVNYSYASVVEEEGKKKLVKTIVA